MNKYNDCVAEYKRQETFCSVIRQLYPEMRQISEGGLRDCIFESKVFVSKNSLSLLDFDTHDIEKLLLAYAEQIYYMHIADVGDESVFADSKEYIEALSKTDNPKHITAQIIGSSALAEVLKVYTREELLDEENTIKREIDTGLTKRLIALSEGTCTNPRVRNLLEHKEQYRNLMCSWDEKDFDCYCDLEIYCESLQSILDSRECSREKRDKINEWVKKIKAILHSSLDDVVSHQSQVKEFFGDFVMDYEILMRENLLENIFEVSEGRVQKQTIECLSENEKVDEVSFEGILIDSQEQVDSMMLHFLNQSLTNNRLDLGRYCIEKRRALALKRGVKREDDIPIDDPELISALRHFVEVLADPIIVDGVAQYDDTKHMEHICTQVVSKENIKKIHNNSVALLFDKNGVSVEDIVLSSSANLESVKGINKAIRDKQEEEAQLSELEYTSVPFTKLIDSQKNTSELGDPKNEVDLSRAFVKPSAVCFFASIPLNMSQKKKFEALNKLAKKHDIPMMVVNLTALNQEREKREVRHENCRRTSRLSK